MSGDESPIDIDAALVVGRSRSRARTPLWLVIQDMDSIAVELPRNGPQVELVADETN